MGFLWTGDEELHYPDGMHRWLCPDYEADGDAWSDRVRNHMAGHTGRTVEVNDTFFGYASRRPVPTWLLYAWKVPDL